MPVPEPDRIGELLATRKLLRVQPSAPFVNGRLKQAAENVDSAKLLTSTNPRAAITIAYDAIRFAVDAHLQANGLRVANEPGAHRVSVTYSRERMYDLVTDADLDDYEALREVRNAIEYPDPGTRNVLTENDATEIAAAAERVVIAVTRWWIQQGEGLKRRRQT